MAAATSLYSYSCFNNMKDVFLTPANGHCIRQISVFYYGMLRVLPIDMNVVIFINSSEYSMKRLAMDFCCGKLLNC